MLTSGILDFMLESRFQGYRKLDTPELAKIRYQTPDVSHFCTKGWGPDGKRLDMRAIAIRVLYLDGRSVESYPIRAFLWQNGLCHSSRSDSH